MPVHNNLCFLKESIDSILNQTVKDFEIIIIDDASTEPIWDTLDAYKRDKRFVFEKNERNIGSVRTLNRALDLAKGDIIARQDSDDISLPTRFEEELKLLCGNVGIVSCYGRAIDSNGKRVADSNIDKKIRMEAFEIHKQMLSRPCNYVLGPAAVFSRSVFDKIGYYDDTIGCGAEDTNYWYRAFQFFDFGVVTKELFLYRINPKSMRKTQRDQFGSGTFGKVERRKWIFERSKTHTVISRHEV